MAHSCGPDCECRIRLNAAADALEAATQSLVTSLGSDSDMLVDTCIASVRAAKARLMGALADFRDHQGEAC